MRQSLKKALTFLLCFAMLVAVFPITAADAANTDSLNKLPDSYISGSGSFTLKTSARIFVVSDSAPTGSLYDTAVLIAEVLCKAGYPSSAELPMVWGPASRVRKGDLVLKLTDGIAADGYRIEITENTLTINATDTDGLLYGTYTLIRYFRIYGGCTLSCATINDAPDTKERTLMLDCARKYWSVEWIENLIREMSWMGYNTLELHMTEDQGIHANIWRDSKGNVVTDCNGNDFGWLPGYKEAKWASDANNGQITGVPVQDPNGSCNYNRDELIEILNCAKKYHIEVIPSVDVPGHCDYFIYQWDNSGASGYFTYNYQGTNYANRPSKIYISDSLLYPNDTYKSYGTLNVANEYTKNMSLALIEAYADFFREYGNSSKMNIGCDEIRGSLSYNTFVSYVNEVCAMLKGRGYSVRAFNDYLYGSSSVALDKDLEICWWQESANASVSRYISDGRKVYNCSNNYCYYVLRYNASQGDARSPDNYWWSFHHSTEDRIYNEWNPSRTYEYNASGSGTPSISGGYFLIWGDWAGWNTESQVWNGTDSSGTYNLIDRMWSNAVKMWNWDINSSLSYSDFATLRESFGDFPGYDGCSKVVSDSFISGGEYALHSAANRSYVLTVEDASLADNANICVRLYHAEDADRFYIVPSAESGYYNIRSALSGKNLDIKDNATGDGTNVRQMPAGNADCQKWSIEKNLDGTYTFVGKTSNKTLDVNGGNPAHKTNVQLWTRNNTNAQKWVLERVKVEISKAPDPTALAALLNRSYQESIYTEESWQNYQTVRAAAQTVYDNVFSPQEALDQAAASLSAAIDALVNKTAEVLYKTMVGEREVIVYTQTVPSGSFSVSLMVPIGYRYLSAEKPAVFVPAFSGADCGTVEGYATPTAPAVVWVKNTPSLTELEELLKEDWSGYDNYAQYEAARDEAQTFYNSVKDDPAGLTYQGEINEYAAKLRAARELLTKPAAATEIVILSASPKVAKGKKVVVKLTTSADVTAVSVDGVSLLSMSCTPFTNADGRDLKYWTFKFVVSTKGVHTYQLAVTGTATVTKEFTVTCR